jgi:foldase protein PrsA
MPRARLGLGALPAALVLLIAACGSSSSNAASVNGSSITRSDLESELRSIASNDQYIKLVESDTQVRGSRKGTFDAAFTAQVLTRQIVFELIDKEAQKRKLHVTPADLAAARASAAAQLQSEDILKAFPKSYQDVLVQRIAITNALSIALLNQGTPDEVARKYYDAHQDQFQRACVSIISLDSDEKAAQVKARLDAGEDFGAVAHAESKDTISAARNGDAGCDISQDRQLNADYSNAVFTQPIGVAGAPVKTPFGIIIVKVNSRTTPPFEQVVAEAKDKVAAQGQQQLTQWYQDAVSKAKISVNPKYGHFQMNGSNMAVVPPQAPSPATTAPGNSNPFTGPAPGG